MLAVAAFIVASTVYVDDAVSLDGTPVANATADIASLTRAAMGEGRLPEGDVVVGRAALFARTNPQVAASPKAAALLKQGEELLLAFEYARAAAALAECAAVVEADLNPADVDVLTRARLLEVEAWVEAKDANAGKDAAAALLVVRPDVVPDATLLSPAARAAFDDAAAAQRALGGGTLEVRTTPDGADVLVDGAVRGKSPLSLVGIAPGVHRVRARAPGYTSTSQEASVPASGHASIDVPLTSTPARRALESKNVDTLAQFAKAAGIDAIYVVGVRTVDGKRDHVTRRIAAGDHGDGKPLFDAAPVVASTTPTPDDTPWLLYGGIGAGALVVTGAIVVGVIALQPQRQPAPALRVVLSL